jgi:Uma2 family endonuclease
LSGEKSSIVAFLIDPAYLPATLTAPPMTDEEFAELCSEHPDLEFEMNAEGDLIVMAPTFSLMGFRNSEVTGQLRARGRWRVLCWICGRFGSH